MYSNCPVVTVSWHIVWCQRAVLFAVLRCTALKTRGIWYLFFGRYFDYRITGKEAIEAKKSLGRCKLVNYVAPHILFILLAGWGGLRPHPAHPCGKHMCWLLWLSRRPGTFDFRMQKFGCRKPNRIFLIYHVQLILRPKPHLNHLSRLIRCQTHQFPVANLILWIHQQVLK